MDISGILEVLRRIYAGNSEEEFDTILEIFFPGVFLFQRRSELTYLCDDDFLAWVEDNYPTVLAALNISAGAYAFILEEWYP